eukprot:365607-Chlamydomonas_euryale.AAC.9
MMGTQVGDASLACSSAPCNAAPHNSDLHGALARDEVLRANVRAGVHQHGVTLYTLKRLSSAHAQTALRVSSISAQIVY